jgi:cold-inducible RNA-binding protein
MAAVLTVREQAAFNPQKPLPTEHPNTSLRCRRYAEATSIRKLLSILHDRRGTHMSMKLFVSNLSFQTSGENLREHFTQAGTVETATVVEDRDTGRSRGFGFVEMSSKEEGEAAIQQLNGNDLQGRNLRVDVAKPRESRDGGHSY